MRFLKIKDKKLPRNARHFPLIIQDMIEDPEDNILQFLLLLVDIIARITASEFRNHEIDDLEGKIVKFLDDRKAIYEDTRLQAWSRSRSLPAMLMPRRCPLTCA